MHRTETHPSAPISKPYCHQNCHSENAEWRMVRDGTTATIGGKELTREFLLSRIKLHAAAGCWEYAGARDANGYGRVFVAGKEIKARRVYFEVFVGPIPQGARLKHSLGPDKCIGSACCNPSHMTVERTFTDIKTAHRICPEGHLIGPDNAVIENRGNNLLIRCRACRRMEWRTMKRRKRKAKPQPSRS
jgi:hypothetical protein